MLDKYMEATEVIVRKIFGTSDCHEAQRYNKVGTTSNVILVDILEELKAIKELLATKPVEQVKIEEEKPVVKTTKAPAKTTK